jgi:flagellar basal body-associated protein FliL
MKSFQLIMYAFYAVLALGACGIGFWFYKKRKEGE